MAILSVPEASMPSRYELPYRIGVDVGGTNTDAVIIDTSKQQDQVRSVLASYKATTTSPNVANGIETAVRSVLKQSNIDCTRIASLAIGTTHFINAIVEQDENRLSRVAVVRLSKSFTREIPPFSDFPPALRALMQGYCTQVDGGLQIDGSPEAPIDESQVVSECVKIKQLGLEAVVVSGVFSPLDQHLHQEETVRDIIQRELPHISVVCSSEISNIGFLERENAAILNASILRFARQTIQEFRKAMGRLGLRCRLYLTQNDGTLIDAQSAARLPIRTVSSGSTNSMRGAAYLCGLYSDRGADGPTTIVCDVGGTTSDFGVLLPSGYPRRTLADTSICGVKVNFDMPQVDSIGIGGGSIIRQKDGKITVGRDSVGCEIARRALVFGGDTMTTTDVAVAIGTDDPIGDASLVKHIDGDLTSGVNAVMKRDFELVCDIMKTSPEPLPLILVGGGSIISPPELEGISEIIRPAHHTVANAIGAAMARISAKVDVVQSINNQTIGRAMGHAVELAKQRVVAAGARPETVVITAQESLPLQYIDNQVRTVAVAVGDFEPSKMQYEDADDIHDEMDGFARGVASKMAKKATLTMELAPILPALVGSYRPEIETEHMTGRKVWVVSPTDLEWMADGCYVLGCGGGGSPYPEMLKLRQHIAEGEKLRIIDIDGLREDARIYWAGNMGSPSVPAERLSASESIAAVEAMMEYSGHEKFEAMIGIEIGGSNGLQPLTIGSSRNFGVPTVDADWMGRAFPNLWQVTVAVQEENQILPCAIASGDGRNLLMTKSPSDYIIDRTLRAPTIAMGYYVGFCAKPTTTDVARKWAVRNTMSQAWRIGRCIARAAQDNTASTVTRQLIDELGGPDSAKLLFHGKIVDVERRLYEGHSHGEVVMSHISAVDENDQRRGLPTAPAAVAVGGELRIPFMNENLLARHVPVDGDSSVIASVPDLITVLSASNGKALGIGEYRYGMIVDVLGIACAPVWDGNEKGLRAGGPGAFGYEHVEHRPLGIYSKPRSVIEEFS